MMGFGFGGLGMIFMLLLWVAIIGLAVWLVSTLFPRPAGPSLNQPGSHSGGSSESSALEIVKKRYAQGEISKAEYESLRRDLQQ